MVYKALHRKLKGAFSNLTYYKKSRNERQRIPKVPSNMDNPEKLATQGTQDGDKKNKNTTQYVQDTTLRKQTYNVDILIQSKWKHT